MRLWSIHPKHLDVKGLVALWREGLLAQAVLSGKTRGYRNHPQLERFKKQRDPKAAIASYLTAVFVEAAARKYLFDKTKIGKKLSASKIPVTQGQLDYEWKHLGRKLKKRDPARLTRNRKTRMTTHPLFRKKAGGIEPWERRE